MYKTVVVNNIGYVYHSANQAGDEFLCDISVGAAPWIEAGVVKAAAAWYNFNVLHYYINRPIGGYCGSPRPF
jgi:hypothetical protein